MNNGLLNYYFSILKSSQDIRQGMSSFLERTGRKPDVDEQAVFNLSAKIMGNTFDNLINSGYSVTKISPDKDFYETEINGVKFVCHGSTMTVFPPEKTIDSSFGMGYGYGFDQNMGNQAFQNQPAMQPTPMRNPAENQRQVNPQVPNMGNTMSPMPNMNMSENMGMNPIPQNHNNMMGNNIPMSNPSPMPVPTPEQPMQEKHNPMFKGMSEINVPSPETVPVSQVPTQEVNAQNSAGNMEGLPQTPFPGSSGGQSPFGGNLQETTSRQETNLYGETGVTETQEPGVVSIGNAPVQENTEQIEKFIEERQKSPYDFLFDTIRISIAHTQMAGSPDEMHIMIAPLVPSNKPQPSVPIVAAFYHKAGYTVKSSYDEFEDGKNLIIIDIGDYSFLCRGSIDGNGNFVSSVVTTGVSAQQGDRLTVIDKKMYGRTSKSLGNGHIKFNYNTDAGNYIFDVFPFDADFNDYIVVSRGPEFVDNLVIGNSMKAASRAIIWGVEKNFEVIVNKNETMGMIEAEVVNNT